MTVPRCMSTQHPDNVSLPFFADSADLGGEDEIREAYYAYSHLGCDEQMWDVEGKEVDAFVVKKLLSRYETFFRQRPLGTDLRLTLRVPNPAVERAEAKVLLETLESIPRSLDAARLFYGDGIAPIFEVILPMTESAAALDRIYHYYADQIIGRQHCSVREGDITVAEWIGEFGPDHIEVIPLFEDRDHMLRADAITAEYLADKDVAEQRVFLARSDPAMNYGSLAAVLMNKIALHRLQQLSERCGVRFAPILGVGSAPFRGNLTPANVERVAAGYPSVVTFTIQSAFKYDNPAPEAAAAIAWLKARQPSEALAVDEARCVDLLDRAAAAYQAEMLPLASVINSVARHVPSRRKRKLHIGLFGYSRSIEGVSLPRAISFTSALYSIGLPPELLGLSALTADDRVLLRDTYPSYEDDLLDALRYADPDCPFMPEAVRSLLRTFTGDVEPDHEHLRLTRRIAQAVADEQTADIGEALVEAAERRRFLG